MTASKTNEDRPAVRYQVFEGDDGWRWRARARNGRILCSSEAFASERNAIRAARDFRSDALTTSVIEVQS